MLLLLILLIISGLYYLKHSIKIDTDLKALFKGTNKTVVELEKLEQEVGSYSTILVVASSPDREKNIEALSNIKKEIENNPLVRFADFDRNTDYIEKHALLFASIDELNRIKDEITKQIQEKVKESLDLEKEKASNDENPDSKFDEIIKKSEKYRKNYKLDRYYETAGGTLIAMKVRPNGNETNIKDTQKIVNLLDDVIQKTDPSKLGVKVEAGGPFRNKLKEMKAIYNDVFSTLAICILLLSFTIIFYFRSFRSLFIVFLPLSVGVLTAISAMQFFTGGFNIISAFSFTILYGLGIDFSIHLLGRFSEERENSKNALEALIKSSNIVIPAITSGAVTTIAAFFSLIFIDFKGFSDFGLAAAIGVSTSFLAIIIFFPSVLFFFDKIKPLKIKAVKLSFLSFVYNKASKKPLIATLLFILITVLGLISIHFAKVEYNFDNLSFPGKYDPSAISRKYIESVRKDKNDFMSTGLPSFILTDSKKETEDVSRALDKIKKDKNKEIEFKDYISIYSFIPEYQTEKLQIIKKIKRLIDRKINLFDDKTIERYKKEFEPYLEVATPLEEKHLPAWITDKLSLKDGTYDKFVIVGLGGNKSDINDVIKIKREYGTIKGDIKDYKLLGSYMLIAEIKNIINNHIPLAVIFSFTAVFLILLLLYLSFKDAVIVFLPLAAGILWMILTAVILGIKFNIFNMIVIPTVIGTGIDSAIHVFHRYKSEKEGDMDKVLKNTGGAVFFSSLTTLVGFGSVAFALHRGLRSIGIMASIGIISVTIVNLLFFPVLIKAWEKVIHNREEKIK